MPRAQWFAGLLAVLGTPVAFAQTDSRSTVESPSKSTPKSLLHGKPPGLIADKDHWLAGSPVTLENLTGRVVWLQFHNSERCSTFRQDLLCWESQYRPCGLVVIEVSGGESLDLETSQSRLSRWEIRHPVLWDKNNRNAKNFGVRSGSWAVLIASDGHVFWQGSPVVLRSRPDEERSFRSLLRAELEKADRRRK